jgi:hypothetical protein
MDLTRFRQILSAFVDSASDLDITKGNLAVQISNEIITAELKTRDGALIVVEGGTAHRAESWIVHRVALADMLAQRILDNVTTTRTFVTPQAELLGRLDAAPTDTPIPTNDALATLQSSLDSRPAGTCSVLYLTSDAGEGKTTLISRLAVDQARRFRENKSDWLLVPISLSGKPFLRFEDVIIASLMNQLRFQRLYFNAFVELVRLGVIIPALDGFEEVFVETADGDAVSSLGTLIRQLGGEGSIMIAARKAYFEFRSLETQARLLDSLPDADVTFARLQLSRWGEQQFLQYCRLNGVTDCERLYSEVTARVSRDHPLVTRAVLVRRLVEIAKQQPDYSFLAALRPESNTFFLRFIDQILEREAAEKWIDKLNDPAQPLLTLKEHHQLLGYIAEEMWASRRTLLSGEMLDSLAEIFCDSAGKSPVVARQVRERLKQHALIVSSGGNRREFAFDHDNFREFFLGEQLGSSLLTQQSSDMRKLMRVDLLPGWTLDMAVSTIGARVTDAFSVMRRLIDCAEAEGPSSYVRENAGALAIRLLEWDRDQPMTVTDLVFPSDAIQGRSLKAVTFMRCYFRRTSLASTTLRHCAFYECEFENIDLDKSATVEGCKIGSGTVIRAVGSTRSGEHVDVYDPEQVQGLLALAGFHREPGQAELPLRAVVIDPKFAIFERAVQSFQRSTYVSLGTFRLRMSIHAKEFFDNVFPDMMAAGILQQETHGPGAHDRYRLGVPMGMIAAALAESNGSYDRCLRVIDALRQRSPR